MATAKKLPSGNFRVRVFTGKPNMLKNVYQHLMEQKEKEVSSVLGKYFSSIICHEK